LPCALPRLSADVILEGTDFDVYWDTGSLVASLPVSDWATVEESLGVDRRGKGSRRELGIGDNDAAVILGVGTKVAWAYNTNLFIPTTPNGITLSGDDYNSSVRVYIPPSTTSTLMLKRIQSNG